MVIAFVFADMYEELIVAEGAVTRAFVCQQWQMLCGNNTGLGIKLEKPKSETSFGKKLHDKLTLRKIPCEPPGVTAQEGVHL